jgi:hypothetical protein
VTDQTQPLADAPGDLFRPRPGHRHVFAYPKSQPTDPRKLGKVVRIRPGYIGNSCAAVTIERVIPIKPA